MKLADILKDSNYKLSQFTEAEIIQLEKAIAFKMVKGSEVPYTVCLVRQKEIKLTPEEVIRQLYLRVLTERLKYPLSRVQVEYTVTFGKEKKRADIAVMDKDRLDTPYIIVELKKPKLKEGKDQLKSYCNATGSPMGVWTNGDQIEHYQRKDPNFFEKIPAIPAANQTLADVLQKKFTLDDLKALAQEGNQATLKEIIDEMEDEVLANAGVDVFEEVFKLIFTKLFDEWSSGRKGQSGKRQLEFYNSGQTETELKEKIQNLFDAAKKKWRGVFKTDDKIALTGSHLMVCVSYLERYKLFNSNLDVVDEAFEYLINQSSKGEKGQYFTPRYVIDMCVKMLNPKEHESMIDTAAGSSGFPVHTMFHVWHQIYQDEGLQPSDLFTAEDKLPRCEDYVEEKVFAIDFDEKAVRVARALNLIAGDGQTNVLHLNTLDYKRWKERLEDDDWQGIYLNGFRRLREFLVEKSDYKGFSFDIVMANPPFAGDIKESLIISSYDLVRDKVGKGNKGVGRDILFIERNLDFLKPGGRMAVVLPQGRFNNSSDKYIRDFIADCCRILAVVGLHGNTFKPHTGTKTSVLFLQKWNDDPKVGPLCPRKEDYNIFFATMQKSGKDNSGDKIYVKRSDGSGDFLLDEHGHRIVDHDLFNHDGLTQDGIAEAFIEFAKKEGLSFFDLSSSVSPFDAVKYERLMGELEASEINYKKVIEESYSARIDSIFFQQEFLQSRLNKINSWSIDEICLVRSGTTPVDRDETLKEGVILLKTNDIRNNVLTNKNIENYFFIDETTNNRMRNTQLNVEDVLLNIVGATTDVIGRSALVTEDFPKANITQAMCLLRVKDKTFLEPCYLFSFLCCFYGNQQIRRIARPTGQYNMNLVEVGSIKLPVLNFEFQKKLKTLVNQSHFLLENSQYIYQQAEDLLLSELGLKDWQPTEKTVAVKSFAESFLSSGRLDAEYYQPKYDELYRKLETACLTKQWKLTQLKSLSSTFKYGTSEPFEYLEKGVPFLRIADLEKYRFAEKDLKFISHEASQNQAIVKTGDVLISRSGTLGLAIVIPEDLNNAIYGSYFILTRPNQNLIIPTYLALYVNSLVGKLQTEQANTGGIQTNLTIPVIESLSIVCPPLGIQQKFVDKVVQSYDSEDKSKQLLEIAKTAVEKAIETDENTATDWINQQLQTLNIDIQKLE